MPLGWGVINKIVNFLMMRRVWAAESRPPVLSTSEPVVGSGRAACSSVLSPCFGLVWGGRAPLGGVLHCPEPLGASLV